MRFSIRMMTAVTAMVVAFPMVPVPYETRNPVIVQDVPPAHIEAYVPPLQLHSVQATTATSAPTVAAAPKPVPKPKPRKPKVKLIPQNVEQWRPLVVEGKDWNPDEVLKVMTCESRGDPNADNGTGNKGLMQVEGGPKDPRANLDWAYSIWKNHGWKRWAAVCRP